MKKHVLCALLLMSGCGDDADRPPDPTVDDQLESAWCDALVRCNAYPDVQTCLGAVDFTGPELAAAYGRGTVRFDDTQAAACQAALAGDCATISDPSALDPCDQVWVGLVDVGGGCSIDAECQTEFCDVQDCDPALACCAGTCATPTPETEVPIGGDCTSDPCVPEAWCDDSATPPTCTAFVAAGQPCTGGECQEGLYCKIDPASGAGTCTALPQVGQPCDPDYPECAGLDTWCDPTDSTCKALVAVGQPCSEELENCVGYAWCSAGTCQALPGAGEPCEDWPGCLGDLVCLDGTCALEAGPDCP